MRDRTGDSLPTTFHYSIKRRLTSFLLQFCLYRVSRHGAMAHILIIGGGRVANLMAVKLGQEPELFESLTIASRTRKKCEAIASRVAG